MKTILVLLVLLTANHNYSQSDPVSDYLTRVKDSIDVHPVFKGGQPKMYEFIGKHIIYPASAQDNNVQGKVYVDFIVSKKGKIKDVKIVKGVHKVLDEEAMRVIRKMPKWTPGEHEGEKISVRYTLPINFNLE